MQRVRKRYLGKQMGRLSGGIFWRISIKSSEVNSEGLGCYVRIFMGIVFGEKREECVCWCLE